MNVRHERLEIEYTRFRMTVPDRFAKDPLASRLCDRVAFCLDAEDPMVVTDKHGSGYLFFSIPECESDRPNIEAIRNQIEDMMENMRA